MRFLITRKESFAFWAGPLDVEALSRLVEHVRNGVALRGQIQHSFGSRKSDRRSCFMAAALTPFIAFD